MKMDPHYTEMQWPSLLCCTSSFLKAHAEMVPPGITGESLSNHSSVASGRRGHQKQTETITQYLIDEVTGIAQQAMTTATAPQRTQAAA